jgi:1,4-alpha-glucan branching enzyme
VLNSDSAYYGGSNAGNAGGIEAQALPWMVGFSAAITLPPGRAVLEPER